MQLDIYGEVIRTIYKAIVKILIIPIVITGCIESSIATTFPETLEWRLEEMNPFKRAISVPVWRISPTLHVGTEGAPVC